MDNNATVFFDTMVFIHCVPIKDIDLQDLLGVKNVNIIIPRITIQELDKHKNMHTSQKIRKRVEQRLKDINSWSESQPFEIRKGITISLATRRPSMASYKEGLDKNWPDDQLIAAVLEVKESHPEYRVVLVSHDTGPKLTALQFGLEATEIPEKWRIPPEEDPLIKENKRLQNELLRIKNSQPRLILCLSEMRDDDQKKSYQLSKLNQNSILDQDSIMDKLRDSFPEINPSSSKSEQNYYISKYINVIGKSELLQITQNEYERYNRERLQFFNRYEEYLDKLAYYRTQPERIIILNLEVRNKGNAPAEDVDLIIHFPNGFSLYTEDSLPQEPTKPSPPDKPRTEMQMQLSSSLLKTISPLMDFRIPSIANDSFSLKKTESYELKDHFKRIKHGYMTQIRQIVIVFDSFDTAKSFNFTYEFNVGNMPNPVFGKINIIIDKEM